MYWGAKMANGFVSGFMQKAKDCCSPKRVRDLVTGKKGLLPYLDRFWVASYSKDALKKGLTGDMVKIITIYDVDEYGDREIKEKPYSKEKIHTLRTVHKIPGADITGASEKSLPIYARTSLMEAEYI